MSAYDPFQETPATRRGDHDGHRRDVLVAARAIIDESGWEGFSIRGVASRAGISTGAVYQWFSGKDEIFGELLREEVTAGVERVAAMPADSLLATVDALLRWVVDLWERLGRYEVDYVQASTGRRDRTAAQSADTAYRGLSKVTDELLHRAASADGVTLVEDPMRITWFWAGCVGTAERLGVNPSVFVDERREQLLRFSAESLVRSISA